MWMQTGMSARLTDTSVLASQPRNADVLTAIPEMVGSELPFPWRYDSGHHSGNRRDAERPPRVFQTHAGRGV